VKVMIHIDVGCWLRRGCWVDACEDCNTRDWCGDVCHFFAESRIDRAMRDDSSSVCLPFVPHEVLVSNRR